MNISVLSLWMAAQAFSAVKASVASTACFYLKVLVLWSPVAHWHISSYSSQAAGDTHPPCRPASERRAQDPCEGGAIVRRCGLKAPRTQKGAFIGEVFIDSAAGFMTCDGWGFFSFPSVHQNRPVIKHPHILSFHKKLFYSHSADEARFKPFTWRVRLISPKVCARFRGWVTCFPVAAVISSGEDINVWL